MLMLGLARLGIGLVKNNTCLFMSNKHASFVQYQQDLCYHSDLSDIGNTVPITPPDPWILLSFLVVNFEFSGI